MRLSTDIFARSFKVPAHLQLRGTLSLLAPGIISEWVYPGYSVLTPVGARIRARLEQLLTSTSRQMGLEAVEIPSVMLNRDLTRGQAVGKQFASKLMGLSRPGDDYHLLSTPEMMFDRIFASHLKSYKNLPVRYVYHTDIFRRMRYVVPMLKERQIRVFGYLEIGDGCDQWEQLVRFAGSICELLSTLAIKFEWRLDPGTKSVHIYHASEEGERQHSRRRTALGPNQRVVGLAEGYICPPSANPFARFRDNNNLRHVPVMTTFGLGTTRVLYALLNSHRDAKGFTLPATCAPFTVSLIPDATSCHDAGNLYGALCRTGIDALLDDRIDLAAEERARCADFLSIANKAIILGDYVHVYSRNGEALFTSPLSEKAVIIQRLATVAHSPPRPAPSPSTPLAVASANRTCQTD